MKKNNKGFMLTELMVVSVAILVLFIAVYSNFYPSVGEYENRLYYNNIDTEYALFYTRVMYLKYLKENTATKNNLFTNVLNEMMGQDITTKADLLAMFQDYKESKEEYEQIKVALKMVKTTGYGVANPTLSDMKLDTPEITKQGSRYGIKLKATAPSIHMIRVDVESTFEPIIGSEMQSKELIDYLMKGSETDPKNIWNSEIFGRSLDVIVQEGIQSKIAMMPENIRYKIQQTMSKVVNKGSNNLIAIVI